MESRIRRKVYVRFGEGDTPYLKRSTVPTLRSLTASVVHPREVMKPAILSNAAALLCCHNHPSGAPQPSQEDRALTKRLVDAGQLLGINVIDHIILGDGSETYYSFADEGLLP